MKLIVVIKSWSVALLSICMLIIGTWQGCESHSSKNSDQPRGRISISGAFALYPLTVKWVEEFRKIYPEIIIDVSAGGAGKGMVDVMAKMVDLGMFSREVSPQEIDKGAWYIAVAKDAVVPTMNQSNPNKNQLYTHGVTAAKLADLYTINKNWQWMDLVKGVEGNAPIHLYTRSDACGAAQVWASFLSSDQESLQGVGVFGDPGMADAVKKDVMGLGYNNIAYAYDLHTRIKHKGIDILPIDFNANGQLDANENVYESLDSLRQAITDGRYPSPPARLLFFISKGEPESELAILFLKWVLTNGQQFVDQAGYVRLTDVQVEEQLNLLQ